MPERTAPEKSTALALAALAFHTPANWYVPWTNAARIPKE